VSTLIVGVLSQVLATEPDLPWGDGRFTPLFPKLMKLLPAASRPSRRRRRAGAGGDIWCESQSIRSSPISSHADPST